MNYYDLIGSRMMLNTLLFTMSELSNFNTGLKKRIKGHQLNIQYSVEGGPCEYIEIRDDKAFFERHKKVSSYNSRIHFKDPKEFLKILRKEQVNFEQLISEGKIEVNENPEFKNICIDLLNFALPYSNNALGDKLSPEDEYILTKIILFALLSGFQEIAEADGNIQAEMRGIDVIIQFKIIEGPNCYFHFQDGTFSGCMDSIHTNPTVTITMSDVKSARDLLTGQGKAARMLVKGNIQIEGDYSHAMKLMNLRELVSDYQDYIKAQRGK